MTVNTPAAPVAACSTFAVSISTPPPQGVNPGDLVIVSYDAQPPQVLLVNPDGSAGPATFTAVGSGTQTVNALYVSSTGAPIGHESNDFQVTGAATGTLTTTLSTVGGATQAATVIDCAGDLGTINGTIGYTLPDGTVVTTPVTAGAVTPVSLGVQLAAGQSVVAAFVPAAGSCSACTFVPTVVSTCAVVLLPVLGSAVPGQPVTLIALVTCNGRPVAGALVDFMAGGNVVGNGATNAYGLVIASAAFSAAGPVSVTAVVTAATTTCGCVGAQSAPLDLTVQTPCLVTLAPVASPVAVGQPVTLSATVTCAGVLVDGAVVLFRDSLGNLLGAGTTVSGVAATAASFAAAGSYAVTASATAVGGDCACTGMMSNPVDVTVVDQCRVVLAPVVAPVMAGQAVPLSALVLCGGAPVPGAQVTFRDAAGNVLGSATSDANGFATASAAFTSAGPVTVFAFGNATGGPCSCANVRSNPIHFAVQGQCSVALGPVPPTVVAGRPTYLSAMVTCNHRPVANTTVTFLDNSGNVLATAFGGAGGMAIAPVTFTTTGPVSVTATASSPTTDCACSNVVSNPAGTYVLPGGLFALPACWRLNPSGTPPFRFTALMQAQVSPATAGVPVSFFVGTRQVGTAATDATGTAVLQAGLLPGEAGRTGYTVTAVVGGSQFTATGSLQPCYPGA